MSLGLSVYLLGVVLALLWLPAFALERGHGAQDSLLIAVGLCALGPVIVLALAGHWLATRKPRHVRAARKAAETAEYTARQAEAHAAREHALGLQNELPSR